MASKVDFEELKALVSITDVAQWLGIKVKQTGNTFRGDCQLCGAEKSFTITPAKGMWGCFKCQKRGSILDMVFHFKDTANVRDAGLLIQQHFLGENSKTVPAPAGHSSPPSTEKRQEEGDPSPPNVPAMLKPLDYLTTDHEAIGVLGLTPEICNALGIGFAPKGTMRGRVVFPLRLTNGALCGYAGLATKADMAPLMLLPKNLEQMISAPVQETAVPPAQDDIRQFLRVVK